LSTSRHDATLAKSPRTLRASEKPERLAAPPGHAAEPMGLQRTVDDPAAADPAQIIALQRTFGNRAVSGLLAAQVQPKLMVGPADDLYEREADQTADRIMTSPAAAASPPPANPEDESGVRRTSHLQRELAPEEEELAQAKLLDGGLAQRELAPEEEELAQAKPLAEGLTPVVRRAPAEAEASFEAQPEVEARLRASQGGGQPLPGPARDFMEQRFGAGFESVRVHTGGEAVQLNRDLHARAFTHGADIYFNEGQYSPASTTGRRLLAHELTHVVQQGGAQAVRRTHVRGRVEAVQRAGWGDRWRAIKAKFTWANIKDALLKTVGGPIYQFYKIYKAKKAGQEVDAFSFKDFKKYAAMLRGQSAGEYGAYIGKVPPLLKILDLFSGEVAGIAGWLTLWFGLLGLLPYCQVLLPLAGTFYGISVLVSFVRLGVNSILDAWSNFLSLYRYRQLERLADRRTGALPDSAQPKIKAYLTGLGEYQLNRGGFMSNLVGAALNFGTTTGANLAGGMSASNAMLGAVDPRAQVSSIVGTRANLETAAATYKGTLGQQTGYGAEAALGVEGLGRRTAATNVGASVGVTPVGEGVSGTFGEQENKAGRMLPRAGHIPNALQAANYTPGHFTNLRQLPKAPLTTTSGKLRGMLNPITAIYQVFAAALRIIRGVVAAVGAAIKLIQKLLKFLSNPVAGFRQAKRYFTERDERGQTGFGRWRARTGERARKWWHRNFSESRTAEQDYTLARAKFLPGVQRQGEDEPGGEPELQGGGPEQRELELDSRTRAGLERLTRENKAQTITSKLTDITTMLTESRDMVGGAADEARGVEAEGG
jgi:hypothetical protein